MNKENKIRNATSLDIDGHKFKSKLEAYCYKRLKEENITGEYEKHIFELQPAFEYTNDSIEMYKTKGEKKFGKARTNIRAITYKPDFVNVKNDWIIECKGFPNDSFPLKWKMFKYSLERNNSNITLYMPRNHKQIDKVIELIKLKQFTVDIATPIQQITQEQESLIFKLLHSSSYTEEEQLDVMVKVHSDGFSVTDGDDLITILKVNQLDPLDMENYNQKAFMKTNKF